MLCAKSWKIYFWSYRQKVLSIKNIVTQLDNGFRQLNILLMSLGLRSEI